MLHRHRAGGSKSAQYLACPGFTKEVVAPRPSLRADHHLAPLGHWATRRARCKKPDAQRPCLSADTHVIIITGSSFNDLSIHLVNTRVVAVRRWPLGISQKERKLQCPTLPPHSCPNPTPTPIQVTCIQLSSMRLRALLGKGYTLSKVSPALASDSFSGPAPWRHLCPSSVRALL